MTPSADNLVLHRTMATAPVAGDREPAPSPRLPLCSPPAPALRIALSAAALVAAAAFLLVGRRVVAEVAGLYALADAGNPYWQPGHATLLYVVTPVVVLGAFLVFLAPGLLLVLASGRARNAGELIVLSFAVSLILCAVLTTLLKLSLGVPVTRVGLLTTWLATALGASALAGWRRHRATATGSPSPVPTSSLAPDLSRVARSFAAVGMLCVLLVPKLFWESFNIDGIEAFEFGRSLTRHLLPRWEVHEGAFGFYQNFVLFAYPNHWFTTVFGPVEAAARLPYLLYVLVLFFALTLLVERGTARLTWRAEAAVWLGLALFTVVQAFNTNYEPYHADLAEMAATDTLWVLCFLATCYGLLSMRLGWFFLFGVLTYLSSPGSLLLLGGLAVAVCVARMPEWKRQLLAAGALLAACLTIGLAYELLYAPLALGGAKNQFSSVNMLARLFPPTLTRFSRLNALIFPCGIVPVIVMAVAWKRDHVARVMTLVTVVCFLVLYAQVWTSLHQYTPVMVLPLVVFWRYYQLRGQARPWLMTAVVGGTALSLGFSLPRHFRVNNAVRHVGLATDYRVGDYDTDHDAAVAAARSLHLLFPGDYRIAYPEQPWGTDAHCWLYYATRPKPADARVNYFVQRPGDPAPADAVIVGRTAEAAVYVRDPAAWTRDRDPSLPRVVVSPLYEPILRDTYRFFREFSRSVGASADTAAGAAIVPDPKE